MPSKSPAHSRDAPGTLYVLATPVGNLEDITIRALRVLQSVELIAAEDTRHTRKLLDRHGIRSPLISCHEHNEAERSPQVVNRLRDGHSVALVADAGTPTVSDPGYRLVREALKAGIRVVPVPGASAVMAALSVSGLPTDAFVFVGFVPRKKQKRTDSLSRLATDSRTLVFFESPRRIAALLEDLLRCLGDREAVLAREMTKVHEEFIRGRISEILQSLEERGTVRGEITLLVSGSAESEALPVSMEQLRGRIRSLLAAGKDRPSEVSRRIAEELNLPRNTVYRETLKVVREQVR